MVLVDHGDGAEPNRRCDERPRRDLRGREDAISGSLVDGMEASAGMTARAIWDAKLRRPLKVRNSPKLETLADAGRFIGSFGN